MTRLALKKDLSYCRAEGRLVFLDISQDRYFGLAPALETEFLRYEDGLSVSETNLQRLVTHGVLAPATTISTAAPRVSVPTPRFSAVESEIARSGALPLMAAAFLIGTTQIQLRTRPLGRLLSDVGKARDKGIRIDSTTTSYGDILTASACFLRARRFVPVSACCLLDSIALVRFLARKGYCAHLVFGVIGEPFAAHCWVQHGEAILNDTLGHVTAHTPIRVI